jgi:hypothetical protein
MFFLFSYVASLLDRWLPVRVGKCRGACGAVEFQVRVPGSSYGLVEQRTAICHCRDCVGFMKACGPSEEMLLSNNGAQMVGFYKSDIQLAEGSRQHVGAVKLTPGTFNIRCYCRRCGTPLGCQATSPVPVVGIYRQLLESDRGGEQEGSGAGATAPLPVFLPSLVLYFARALPGTRPYGGCAVVRDGFAAPLFILVGVLGRVAAGLAFGKGGAASAGGVGGLLPPSLQDEKSIAVGIESIQFDGKPKDQ